MERIMKNKIIVQEVQLSIENNQNKDFNSIEFDGIRNEAGYYGGTYAHKDIAFEFASWISVNFKGVEFDSFKNEVGLNNIAIEQLNLLLKHRKVLGE